MRLIDADALRNSFKDARDAIEKERGTEREWITWNARLDTLDDVIWQIDNNFPTIEAEPVRHGRWVRKDEAQAMFGVEWRCSECGSEISTDGIYMPYVLGWKHCYNCGAKMDAKEADHATD